MINSNLKIKLSNSNAGHDNNMIYNLINCNLSFVKEFKQTNKNLHFFYMPGFLKIYFVYHCGELKDEQMKYVKEKIIDQYLSSSGSSSATVLCGRLQTMTAQ